MNDNDIKKLRLTLRVISLLILLSTTLVSLILAFAVTVSLSMIPTILVGFGIGCLGYFVWHSTTGGFTAWEWTNE